MTTMTATYPADAEPIKGLVVRQPWASLIATGRKTLEIRSWRTRHRGEILIVAGMTAGPAAGDLPRGVAVAIVRVSDCRPFTPADTTAAGVAWQPGLWAWVLGDVRPTPPIPVRGQPGLFAIPRVFSRGGGAGRGKIPTTPL